jgi:hypothetical protein
MEGADVQSAVFEGFDYYREKAARAVIYIDGHVYCSASFRKQATRMKKPFAVSKLLFGGMFVNVLVLHSVSLWNLRHWDERTRLTPQFA